MPFGIFTTLLNTCLLLKHSARVAIAMTCGMAQKRKTVGSRKRFMYSRLSVAWRSASVTCKTAAMQVWGKGGGPPGSRDVPWLWKGAQLLPADVWATAHQLVQAAHRVGLVVHILPDPQVCRVFCVG